MIKQFVNDSEVAALAISESDRKGNGNPTLTSIAYPELDENGERTGKQIRTMTITFRDAQTNELCSDTVALEDLEAAVKAAVDAPMESTSFGYVSDGAHVPGPKPGPPAPGDTPPELEEDPLPPLASGS